MQVLVAILLILTALSFFSLAPWVPTKANDLERINKLIKFKKNENFLEMWCWNARVVLFLASKNPNNYFVWIELSPLFYLISKIRCEFSWLKNVKIVFWNVLKYNIEDFDVLYVFWLPETITKKVFPILDKKMKKTTRFFSYVFKMTNNKFYEKKHKESDKLNSLYEYKRK